MYRARWGSLPSWLAAARGRGGGWLAIVIRGFGSRRWLTRLRGRLHRLGRLGRLLRHRGLESVGWRLGCRLGRRRLLLGRLRRHLGWRAGRALRRCRLARQAWEERRHADGRGGG